MKGIGKFLCTIGEIAAVLIVIGLLVQYIDNIYHFIPVFRVVDGKNMTILDFIIKYGVTLVVGIIALGASMKVHPIVMIIVALVIAAVVGFMFYGDFTRSLLPEAKDAAVALVNMIA